MFISHALPYRAGIPLRTQPYFPLVPARAAGRPNSARYPKAGPPELRSAGMRIPANRSPTASRTTGDDRTTGLRTQCSGIFSGSAPFRPAPAFRQNRQAATFLRSQRCPQAIGFRPEIPILVTLRVVQPRERLQTPQEIGIVPFGLPSKPVRRKPPIGAATYTRHGRASQRIRSTGCTARPESGATALRSSPRTGPDRKPSATAESRRKPAARSQRLP